jgi:hypothetical protein
MVNILPARNESSQVRSQPNRVQSLGDCPETTPLTCGDAYLPGIAVKVGVKDANFNAVVSMHDAGLWVSDIAPR